MRWGHQGAVSRENGGLKPQNAFGIYNLWAYCWHDFNIDAGTSAPPFMWTPEKPVPFLRTHTFLLLKELDNSFQAMVSGLTVSHTIFL